MRSCDRGPVSTAALAFPYGSRTDPSSTRDDASEVQHPASCRSATDEKVDWLGSPAHHQKPGMVGSTDHQHTNNQDNSSPRLGPLPRLRAGDHDKVAGSRLQTRRPSRKIVRRRAERKLADREQPGLQAPAPPYPRGAGHAKKSSGCSLKGGGEPTVITQDLIFPRRGELSTSRGPTIISRETPDSDRPSNQIQTAEEGGARG